VAALKDSTTELPSSLKRALSTVGSGGFVVALSTVTVRLVWYTTVNCDAEGPERLTVRSCAPKLLAITAADSWGSTLPLRMVNSDGNITAAEAEPKASVSPRYVDGAESKEMVIASTAGAPANTLGVLTFTNTCLQQDVRVATDLATTTGYGKLCPSVETVTQ
jgi:hypothetical protein